VEWVKVEKVDQVQSKFWQSIIEADQLPNANFWQPSIQIASNVAENALIGEGQNRIKNNK
jgi:hypothetical protein